jgi:hypothetical protein
VHEDDLPGAGLFLQEGRSNQFWFTVPEASEMLPLLT